MRLFVEPEAGVDPVVRFIDRAQHRLDVAMYLLTDREVQSALESDAKRGVRVRVMFEEHPYGTGPGNQSIHDSLRLAGIQVAWSPGQFQLSHDKYALADGKVALVGTANWTYSAFTRNREYFVEDTDSTDVGQLETLFNSDWGRQTAQLTDAHLVVSPINSRPDFVALINSAQRNVRVEAEEMQDPGVEDALIQAAKRGVTVQVILPRPDPGRHDPNLIGEQRITNGGVAVRTLRTPYVHAKSIEIDSHEALIGSENVSAPSLDDNREVGLLISDQTAIQQLRETFNHDWGHSQH